MTFRFTHKGYLLQKCMIGLCWILALAGSIPIFKNFRTQNINGSEDKVVCTTDTELYEVSAYYSTYYFAIKFFN